QRRFGADADDRAGPGFLHKSESIFGGQEKACQIEIEEEFEILDRERIRRDPRLDASYRRDESTRDADILTSGIERGFDRIAVRHVCLIFAIIRVREGTWRMFESSDTPSAFYI